MNEHRTQSIENPALGRYGVRWAYWADTHERFGVATIDGKPVGPEPSEAALEKFAEDRGLCIVSQEMMRDLTRRAAR